MQLHGLRHNAVMVDFDRINAAAMDHLPSLLAAWLPGGSRKGDEFFALNPRRCDRHLGSFAVNMRNGRWADFATGDKGGDVISLAAFIFGTSQAEAARMLGAMLGVDWRRGYPL
jgi:hypothetical protein